MKVPPKPAYRRHEEVLLVGRMSIYDSQAEASSGIPGQWQAFLAERHGLDAGPTLYGASPCTGDRKIHYLAGIERADDQGGAGWESLTLEAGEYAVVLVEEPAQVRETWMWLLGTWLRDAGRREKNVPEFERFTSISESGTPVGPVELWIPLEPIS